VNRRGSTLLEVLAVFLVVFVLIAFLFRINQSEIQEDLNNVRSRETATRELWLIRIDSPEERIWMWTDENGVDWVLFAESNRVHRLGENDG
jgi:hypothetical protein